MFLAVYGVDSASNGALVKDTQSILHSLAGVSHDIKAFLDANFDGLVSRASKMAVGLMLAQHHVSYIGYTYPYSSTFD